MSNRARENVIADLERQCQQIEARGNVVKRDIHKFAENMIALIETKKKETLNKADKQIEECEVKRRVKLLETAVEKTETLLKYTNTILYIQMPRLYR